MCTFNELMPHLRGFNNWYGKNYFPCVECVIKYKNYVVDMIHVPNNGADHIGVNTKFDGVIICSKNTNDFLVYPNTRCDV